jgi:hypothetical protein
MIRFGCASGLLVVLVCIGCGPRANPHFQKTTAVRGKVTFANGSPVRGGLVTLHPKDGSKAESRGTIDKDGRFTLGTYKVSDGTMAGAYAVTVEPIVYDKRGNMRPDRSLRIPAKYADPDSSGLTVEIKDEDSQEVTLVLR